MSPRYARGLILTGRVHPEPTYPEYPRLRAEAEERVLAEGRFVNPAQLAKVQRLNRSWEWKVSVLGHDGDGTQTRLDMQLLLVADEWDLNPDPPAWLVEMRREGAERDAAQRAARRARDEADAAASRAAEEACEVALTVQRNGTARPRHGFMHNLGHFVPAVDAYSGFGARRRRHRAGRALCESAARATPLDLSGGTGGAATCVSCLRYAPMIRRASI